MLRTLLASDSIRGAETLEAVRARGGTVALVHQLRDLAAKAGTRLGLDGGGPTPGPSPAGNTSPHGTPPAP